MRIKSPLVIYCFALLSMPVIEGFCAAAPAEFRGRVVNEAGDVVTDFFIQAGVPNPQKPEEIIWSESFSGPWIGRPGWFGVQARRSDEVWRVTARGYVPQPVLEGQIPASEPVVVLKRGGALHGTIYDHLGRAAPGARVFLIDHGIRMDLEDGTSRLPLTDYSAVTDAEGHFTIQGIAETERRRLFVLSAGGFPVAVVPKIEPGHEVRISMPELASLIVRYAIPDDILKAPLRLEMIKVPSSDLTGMFVRHATVTNQGQFVFTGLLPGTYDLARTKSVGTVRPRTYAYSRAKVVVAAGQTGQVNFFRSSAYPVRGQVLLEDAKGSDVFIFVRSAEATGDLRNGADWKLPLFDVVTCDEEGHFSTAGLEPGAYAFVVEVYQLEKRNTSRVYYSDIPSPTWVGLEKITVRADSPPEPLAIALRRER